jgi:5-oxoprolinase (ATP-hydrolysing)
VVVSVYETQEPSSYVFGDETLPTLTKRLDKLSEIVRKELVRQGFSSDRIHLDRRLNMRFDGTDTALLISSEKDTNFETEFKKSYQQEFGFLLESRVMVDDINVRCIFDDVRLS